MEDSSAFSLDGNDRNEPLDRLKEGVMSRRGFVGTGAGLAAGMLLAACGGGGGGGSVAPPLAKKGFGPTGPAKSGGRLRVGLVGGGQAEILNPLVANAADIDLARQFNLFDWLVYPGRDGAPQLHLAESMEHNADATEWTIRLRKGVEWHDGKPLTAEDLMYTMNYMADPKTGSFNQFVTAYMDLKRMKKLDDVTVRIPMKTPMAALPGLFMCSGYGMIQDGTTSFNKPIGTGPFKFVSWTKGQSSLFARNENYWMHGKPYVDELELISIPDTTARINALLGGQVDAAIAIPYAQAAQYLRQGDSAPMNVLLTQTPQAVYFTMGMAHKPFEDPRVRQAMRLIVDRKAMIEQVQSGLGKVGNDLFGLGYPYYNDQLPQRQQDLEKAKALLKQAGHENLTVTLSSSSTSAGQLEAATLFAQQAKAAGVTVNVRRLPAATYYSSEWPNYAFGQTQWSGTTIPYFYAQHFLPNAYNNDSQWKDPATVKLTQQALREPDETKAKDLWFEMQQKLYDYGPQIHWGTCPYVDGVSKKVGGVEPNAFWDLSCFSFKDYWLS